MDLNDVLSDKEPDKPAAPEAPPEPSEPGPKADPSPELAADGQPKMEKRRREHQKREWEAQGRDPETGQFLPKEKAAGEPEKKAEPPAAEPPKAPEPAKPAAPPPPQLTDKERAAFAAAADERRKRQELERRLAELEKAKQQPEGEKKTFWDDPDGALKATEQRVTQATIQARLATAETIARSRYQDFDEKIGVFKSLVEQNPALVQSWLAQPDPAEYAYRLAANHMQLQAVGNLDAYRKKVEEETAAKVRAEMEAEHKRKLEELERQRAALPPTLSDVRGAGSGNKAAVWGGPTPLSDVLGKPN